MRNVLLLFFFLFLSGCVTTTPRIPVVLSSEGAQVNILPNDPPAALKEIGPVEVVDGYDCGMFGKRGKYEDAYILLKNKVAEMGATHVKIIDTVQPHSEHGCFDNRFTIRGVAFK